MPKPYRLRIHVRSTPRTPARASAVKITVRQHDEAGLERGISFSRRSAKSVA
jgi:hypothetical protein